MAGAGRISLLIDSPLRTMMLALRSVPAETRKQIAAATKKEAQPIWFQETRDRAATRMQQRVLVDSARVGVTARNVILRSGGTGSLRNGTPVAKLAEAAEFGIGPNKRTKEMQSRHGVTYTRRVGAALPLRRRAGWVVYPAAKDSIPRFASLWVSTAVRTILDAFDEVD